MGLDTKAVYYVESDGLKVVLARLLRQGNEFCCDARKEGKRVKLCVVHGQSEYRWVQANRMEKTFTTFESLEKGLLKLLPRPEDIRSLHVNVKFDQEDVEPCH